MSDTLYDWLLFLHIVAAMVWVGGGVVLAALATRVLHDREPTAVSRFIASLRVIGPATLAPATVAAVGLGIWLVLDSGAWDFGQFWVQFGLALFLAAFAIGAGYLSGAAIHAERAAAAAENDEAIRQLTRWSWGYRVIVLLLVVATWDMVFKPGL
jgi:uncharacterized membrane protein